MMAGPSRPLPEPPPPAMSADTPPLRYDADAARELLPGGAVEALADDLLAARDEVLADVELFRSGGSVPESKQPLDAGFIEMPADLLAGGSDGLLDRIDAAAGEFRARVDACVVLGIGGSYMGMRALQEALLDPHHNERSRSARGEIPRLYYDGNNADSDATRATLSLLTDGRDPQRAADRWGIVVISKSGGTLETAAAFRIYRQALEDYYGADSEEARNLVIPVTGGEGSKLRALAEAKGYPHLFPVPDGVGGRFSVLSAVGLLPAAIEGIDVRALLQGAADMTEQFKTAEPGRSPVLDYVGVCHAFEEHLSIHTRILSTWGKMLEATGLWYDQLLAESLGKQERGAFPLTVVNTRDLHSRGQQHQEGRRDKLITNLYAERPRDTPLPLPESESNQDQLNRYAGKSMQDVLDAARVGNDKAYLDDRRPTANLVLPQIDAYGIGALLQMLMLATVVEGRLIGINPYGQPGVEAYKRNMNAILAGG